MTKLLTFYNETFSEGYQLTFDLWNILKTEQSLNGVFLAFPDYLGVSKIGTTSSTNLSVETWYNLLADGNYLYTSLGTPLLTLSDSQFNNYPSIDFSDTALTQMLLKFPLTVRTIMIVYLTRVDGSYLIYAPRTVSGSGGSALFYDAFPSGGNKLWGNELLNSSSIYNATSRINGRNVSSNVVIPTLVPRILTVKNFGGVGNSEQIHGFGGQSGGLGGAGEFNLTNSVHGKIAAILTFENDIDINKCNDIELALASYYINYTGTTVSSSPQFKYLINTTFNFNFNSILIDEWFDITLCELVTPIDIGLSFTGTLLSGTLTHLYNNNLTIRVTNSGGFSKLFTFSLIVCKSDPIITSLPQYTFLSCILSAAKDIDGADYGTQLNQFQEVTQWEDARRIGSLPLFLGSNGTYPSYVPTNTQFNNKGTVKFTDTTVLTSSTTVNGNTFVWVYSQANYGFRSLLNTFLDIKGTGVLWTVDNNTQIHGQTPVTKLIGKIDRELINTLNYKLPLNRMYIITATTPDTTPLSFTGLTNLRGDLAFFASWSKILTTNELNTVVSLLANRYANSLAPVIFDTQTEYRNSINVVVDLTKKVVDYQNLNLTYNLLTPHYDAAIDSNGLLTFTAVTDEILTFSIDITNTIPLTSNLTFNVDVTVRTNPLYLNLKTLLGDIFTGIFIADDDTLTFSGSNVITWKDYRFNGLQANGTNVLKNTLNNLNSYNTLDFNIDGSSSFDLSSSLIGKSFNIVYVRKENVSGRAFLFGQNSSADFLPGNTNQIFDSTASSNILNGSVYVNNINVAYTSFLTPVVMNTITINTQNNETIDSIAKDRMFTDRSVKGYIPLLFVCNRNLTSDETTATHKLIRDYYDPPSFVTLIHADSTINDSSNRNKTLGVNGSITNSIKRFGSGSFILTQGSTCNYINIPNATDFAYLNEDFTISFWLNITDGTNNEPLILYNQSDLTIYIYSSILYINRNLVNSNNLINSVLASSFFNNTGIFHHIELCRVNLHLYLFIDGTLVGDCIDVNSYIDYNTNSRIGSTSNLLNTSINSYLDEIVIYRRQGFNTNSFTPPTSPYIN